MAAWAAAAWRMNRIWFSLRCCYGFRVRLLAGERADLGERTPRPARQGDRQRVGGEAEGGDERDADDRADPAVQDAEPVPGLGWLGQPLTDHGQDRDLHALGGEQPGRGHRAGRRGGRAAGYQYDWPASGPQRALAWPGAPDCAHVPGRAEQPGQGGY